jgi:alkane 1-monooxygenase
MHHVDALPNEPSPDGAAPSALGTLRIWSLHAISLALPLYVLAFASSGPHPPYRAFAWLAIVPITVLLDRKSGPALHAPREKMAAWPFDVLLLVLAALQLVNVALALRLVQQAGFFTADTFVAWLLVGVASGYSTLVVAHELIHRRSRGLQLLGRLLLATVIYEHFYVEHVRGHHLRIGTDDDPATSRYGESYKDFFWRTVPAQFRSAWRLEAKRLGDEDMPWYDPRLLRSDVVHGIVAEVALALGVLFLFGPGALALYLGQAYVAVRLLEAVNYFEHYGLRRLGRKVRPVDSWDSDSWFTLFALVGLSRHADHHAYASRPFQALRTWEESPKLPHGYILMVIRVVFDNANLRVLLDAELERRRLGPFVDQLCSTSAS